MAMRTRTLAAAGNLRVRTPMAHTAGTILLPPTITTHPVEPAGDQARSADSPAEAVADGNRDPQARAAGAVAGAAEAGVVAAPVAEAGAVVEVSVVEVSVVEGEDKSRSTVTQ